ncbi:hypothetical protein [Mycolicibacterium brumae]|uniref:Uncharacterized protein n=1 Tax=Mycolicibacterium brumae TaxID=85968 RepID=A0A2G5P7T4_9MYCO|nr:hypothetical protein [Mycolicibacterium brumae]MCV7194114.1 hypothetical protein [Mycolicibacterium brumae]PIB74428.1 hypothetical protein CQY22_013245 [Mycolicibacterium brumae]RWA22713.1 hypothetical protein MBRU_12245 [Mycolicibacterium brumae DSM 44177]UWW07481.1 hypothetical protein L2Z93_000496 [Mycolicibacterium brumae]
MLHDLADLHPLLLQGLRTGVVPSSAEIAEATGKTLAEVERILEAPDDDETDEDDAEPEDPDAQQFRDRYHWLVEQRCAGWLEEHDDYREVPDGVRRRIEADCNDSIQYQWRQHLAARRERDED